MSEKTAIYGYDQWRMRAVAIDAVKTAIGHGGASYTMAYWQPNVGPYVQVDDPLDRPGRRRAPRHQRQRGLLAVGRRVRGVAVVGDRAFAVDIDQVRKRPGYVGGALAPNATVSDIPTDKTPSDNLVMVTDVYERPCPRVAGVGRWFTIAAGKVIVDARLIDPRNEYAWQDYPLKDPDGTPCWTSR
jgi:hypothetical protein